MDDRRWRLWGAAIALCAWSGVILQLVRVTIRLGSVIGAVERLSLFFTTISNLAVAIVYSLIALGLVRFRHPLLVAGLALTMLMVGAVFELMLRAHVPMDGLKWLNNLILHDIVPALCVAAYLVRARKGQLRARDPWIMALFPLFYLLYALVRGAIGGVYPYPFLDPVRIGWHGVALYVLGISVIFLAMGHLMVALDRRLARRR
jgi:hypothetical protein